MEAGPVTVMTLLAVIALAIFLIYVANKPEVNVNAIRELSSAPAESRSEHASFTRDEFSSVALDMVYGKMPETSDSFFGGTIEDCERALARIAELRKEYDATRPRELRQEVMSWLDWSERQAREDMEDIRTQKTRHDQDAFQAKEDAHAARVRALKDALGH